LRLPRSILGRVLLGLVAAALLAVAIQEVWRALAFSSEKDRFFTGVRNFGKVNARLYRGAQPSPSGYAALKAIGVDTVVRLSLADDGGVSEEQDVTAAGMRYVSIPMTTARAPSDYQAFRFLTLVRDNPQSTVFVHCKSGVDRTGVMVALTRITFDHWPVEKAINEMYAFHYHELFLPHLQRYVEEFDPARVLQAPATAGSGGKF
jgi:protein tyrosine/serine phosphatase